MITELSRSVLLRRKAERNGKVLHLELHKIKRTTTEQNVAERTQFEGLQTALGTNWKGYGDWRTKMFFDT